MASRKPLAFVGSVSEQSVNRKLLREVARRAAAHGIALASFDFKEKPMPFYNADLEATSGMPPSARQFREQLLASDPILIVSPEYNASVPALLKNAIDWASRSEQGAPSREAFKGKRFLLLSASPSGLGGARALAHLCAILDNLGGVVVNPTISVSDAYNAFAADGTLHRQEIIQKIEEMITQELM